MNEASPRGTPSRSPGGFLRLPLLLVTGLLSMGSGMGNPGCGDGAGVGGDYPGPPCQEGCTVEGTWQLTYADTRPLSPECLQAGATLPSGRMEITRSGADVTLTVGDVVVTGTYYGDTAYLSLFLGSQPSATPGGEPYSFRLFGELSMLPASAEEPLTWTGTVYIDSLAPPEKPCREERAFTARR